MRIDHWTLFIGMLALAGCHDFTITHRIEGEAGVRAEVDVVVDDGHAHEHTEEPSMLSLTLESFGQAAVFVTEDLVASVPMSPVAQSITDASLWELSYSVEKGLGIAVTEDDLKRLFRSTGPTVPPTIEVLDLDARETVLATFEVGVDLAGNEVLLCTPAGEGPVDVCDEHESGVQDALFAVGIDLGLETTSWGGGIWDACIARLLGAIIWEVFHGNGQADPFSLSDPACHDVLGL